MNVVQLVSTDKDADIATADTNDHDRLDLLAQARVLVVDDEPGMRNFLQKVLQASCAEVDCAANVSEASTFLDEKSYDVVVLDNIMPTKTGVQWLSEQREIGFFSEAILITAHADLDTAIAALRAGASDFLLKPFRSNQLLNAITQSLTRTRLRKENSALKHELEAGRDILRHRDALLGSSAKIEAVRQTIARAAQSESPVVILSEVGSGNQIAARMLHAGSPRRHNPFVWLNCHGLSDSAFEARMLGSIKQGAESDLSEGVLTTAAGGTLFLEEIETLSSASQGLLTELLSTGRYQPVGASRSQAIDVRIVASTSRGLKDTVDQGEFRSELFYLLNVIEIALPPLRERSEDIITLAQVFIEHLSERMSVVVPALDEKTKRKFLAHAWPGNVLELRNTVERGIIQGSLEDALPDANGDGARETLAEIEKRHILSVLNACRGNRAEAARRLDVARKTIDRKCQAWGL
ncbi:MAG: sigma-54 dependent transcriptional regulator [Pseudomonadota bacterium]